MNEDQLRGEWTHEGPDHAAPASSGDGVVLARPLHVARPFYSSVITARPVNPYLYPYLMSRRAAVVDVVIMLLGMFTAVAAVQALMLFGALPPESSYLIVVQPMVFAFVSLSVIATLLRMRGQRWDAVGLGPIAVGRAIGLGVLSVFASYFINLLLMLATLAISRPGDMESIAGDKAPMVEMITGIPVYWILPITIVVGLYEELVVRGLLMSRLMVLFRHPAAPVALSALLFGVLHYSGQGFFGVVQTFALGLLFGALAVWQRNLWPCVIGHVLLNTFAFVMLQVFEPYIREALQSLPR